jgi:DNA-binding MarR family transcriptional regulator
VAPARNDRALSGECKNCTVTHEFLILRDCILSVAPQLIVTEMATAQLSKNPPVAKGLKKMGHSGSQSGQTSFEAMDQFLGDLDRQGISLRSLQLLVHLQHVGDDCKRLSLLAPAIGVSGAGITGVADLLEDKGLVVRVVKRQDRRSVYLTLTPNGAKFASWVAESLGRAFGKTAA